MRRWSAIAASYVGAVVGAGFGSGREIAHFFAAHGAAGLAGSLLAGGLFGCCGMIILRRATAHGHRHHGELLRDLCGPVVGPALDRLMTALLLVTVGTVLAGAGALAVVYGHQPWVGVLPLAVALLCTAAWGQRGHIAINAILVPLLVALAILACVRAWTPAAPLALLHASAWLAPPRPGSWALDAVLYVAYNLLLGLAGMCAGLGPQVDSRDASRGGLVGGLTLGVLCTALCAALLRVGPDALTAPLPLRLALPQPAAARILFPLCLAGALWTTGSAAVSALLLRWPTRRPALTAAAGIAIALPLALAGLAWLVAVLYPLMGYAGLPVMVGVARSCVPRRRDGGRR